jgi:dynein heavy chain
LNLWSLPVDDENYIYVKENIESILEQNLKNIEGCLEIYEDYAYLLREVDKAMVWA